MSTHSAQTDPYLHEIKGASTALAGQVPTATGLGTAVFSTPAFYTPRPFTVSSISGLDVTVSGGSMMLATGQVLTVPDKLISITTSPGLTYTYVYLDTVLGALVTAPTLYYSTLYRIAQLAGVITDVKDLRVEILPVVYNSIYSYTVQDINLQALPPLIPGTGMINIVGTFTSATSYNITLSNGLPPTFIFNSTNKTLVLWPSSGGGNYRFLGANNVASFMTTDPSTIHALTYPLVGA